MLCWGKVWFWFIKSPVQVESGISWGDDDAAGDVVTGVDIGGDVAEDGDAEEGAVIEDADVSDGIRVFVGDFWF